MTDILSATLSAAMPGVSRKPPIVATSVGEPALDSIASLVLARLAARQRPALRVVTDEQPSSPVPAE